MGKAVYSQNNKEYNSTLCDQYMNAAPLNRMTTSGEENVVNSNYQAVAQQYDAISGQIKSVVFWARVNPASNTALNTVKVVVYMANQGLPGVILGQQNTQIDSANTNNKYTATFASPITVNGNIIISIEPLSAANDNFFVKRNSSPDGMNLNLIKIKQSNQWFKNLAAGDTTYDFDFLILPVKASTVSAGFSASTSNNVTNFTNTSSGGNSYLWDFGDGDTSTLSSPAHSYTSSNLYAVKLKTYSSSSVSVSCIDSVTNAVNVVITGIKQVDKSKKNEIKLQNNVVSSKLVIESGEDLQSCIYSMLGIVIKKIELKKNSQNEFNVEELENGMYFICSEKTRPLRFIKIK